MLPHRIDRRKSSRHDAIDHYRRKRDQQGEPDQQRVLEVALGAMGRIERRHREDGQRTQPGLHCPGHDAVVLTRHAGDGLAVDGRPGLFAHRRRVDHVESCRVCQTRGHRDHSAGRIDDLDLPDLAASGRQHPCQQPRVNQCFNLVDPVDQE